MKTYREILSEVTGESIQNLANFGYVPAAEQAAWIYTRQYVVNDCNNCTYEKADKTMRPCSDCSRDRFHGNHEFNESILK